MMPTNDEIRGDAQAAVTPQAADPRATGAEQAEAERKLPDREFSDEQITAFIDDPTTILDHETAMVVIDCLNAEIAGIQSQIGCAQVEAEARGLSPEREAWLRRASYAAAMRRNERHAVMQRDKELRGVKGAAATEPKRSKEEKLLKQQRLLEEAQARRAAKQTERDKLALERERIAQRQREIKAQQLGKRISALQRALFVPEVWSEEESEGLVGAFDLAHRSHGLRESLFAAAAWLLRHRAALAQGIEAEGRDAQRLGAKLESPVAESDAPSSPSSP